MDQSHLSSTVGREVSLESGRERTEGGGWKPHFFPGVLLRKGAKKWDVIKMQEKRMF